MASPPLDSNPIAHSGHLVFGHGLAHRHFGLARYPAEPEILTGIRTTLGIAADPLALTTAADQPVCVAIAPAQTHRKLVQTDSEWISAPT